MNRLSTVLAHLALSAGLLAGLSACGSSLPTSNDRLASLAAADLSNPASLSDNDKVFLDEVFSVLDTGDGNPANATDKASRWQDFKDRHGDFAARFEALKSQSPEQRKARMAEIGKQFAGQFASHRPPASGQTRHLPTFASKQFKASPEQLKAFAELKALSPEARRTKLEALRSQHAKTFPPAGFPVHGPEGKQVLPAN